MSGTGAGKIPADFRYRNVFLKGKPQHDVHDPFRSRHPSMDRGRRAKIFAPFDALRGFSEAVASKDVLYKRRVVLYQEEKDELNRRLQILHGLTRNSRMARASRVQVAVTYYEPCRDENHEAYGLCGRYQTITGICRSVDAEETGTILIREKRISIEDILKIESVGAQDVFRRQENDDFQVP